MNSLALSRGRKTNFSKSLLLKVLLQVGALLLGCGPAVAEAEIEHNRLDIYISKTWPPAREGGLPSFQKDLSPF